MKLFRRIFTTFFLQTLLSLVLIQPIFCDNFQNNSDKLYKRLVSIGLNPEKQLLSGVLSEAFPYNILIYIEENNHSEEDFYKHTLILSLNQTDVFSIFDQLFSFIKSLEKNKPNIPVIVLLTANDDERLPSEFSKAPAGTRTFFESLEKTESDLVFVFSIDNNYSETNNSKPIEISTGGKKTITPLDLLKLTTEEFNEQSIQYSIPIPYFSLYRMNAIDVVPQLGFMLDNNIPAIGINLKNPTQATNGFSIIESISRKLKSENFPSIENWDKQYSIINFLNRTFVFTEKFQIITFILVSGFFLAFFCAFTFLRKTTQFFKSDILKTIYLPILMIVLNIASLFIAQKICTTILSKWELIPRFSFFIKMLLSLSIFYTLSNFQFLFSFPQNYYVYSLYTSIFALLNFFIFSAIDFSLMIFFAATSLIFYLTKTQKKWIILLLIFFLSIIPFLPIVFSMITNANDSSVYKLVNAKFSTNLLLSFLLLPTQLIFVRIRVSKKNLGKNYWTTKRHVLKSVLIPFGFTVFTICALSVLNNETQNKTKYIDTKISVQDSNFNSIKVNSTKEKKIGFYSYELELTYREEVVQYDIEIHTDTMLPLFDSDYPCDIYTKANTAHFSLEENPPSPFVLSWKSETDNNPVAKVTAWIPISEKSFKREHYEIDFRNAGKK